jgi:hypothetical protein
VNCRSTYHAHEHKFVLVLTDTKRADFLTALVQLWALRGGPLVLIRQRGVGMVKKSCETKDRTGPTIWALYEVVTSPLPNPLRLPD